ncbi:MAG TPA: hypothetical protein VGC97_17005 [Pyrinomonadaceae bacterium]|jgi:hypothetical protein
MGKVKEKSDYFSRIIGEQLSAVSFVMDYLQLQFNGYFLTVLTPLVVVTNDRTYSFGDLGFRDTLCERIAQKVIEIVLTSDYLRIVFEDNTFFSISLRQEDYVGAEAINLHFPEGTPLLVI